MTISRFPNGFSAGLLVRNIPISDVCGGKVFFVGNNATAVEGEKTAADTNLNGKGGSFLQPFASIDYAIGQCVANRGDIIYVRSGHAVSVVAAGGIALDVAGVSIIGLGAGENRPTVSFATSANASITISAANCRISNLLFKCNIASQNHMIDLTATDCTIDNCAFREGSATGLTFITADTADSDSQRLRVIDCSFHAPTAGNYDSAICLGKDFTGVRVVNCDMYGDFDDACFNVPAGGNAQVDLRILSCRMDNLQTGRPSILINSTTNTGMIAECYCQGDTLASIIDTGGLSMFQTYVHDKADQSYAIVTGTIVS